METNNIPLHIGIIMDGNGRWAKLSGKNRSFGHKKGSEIIQDITEHAFKSGVKTLTLYAFSQENWNRPKEEVDELMRLLSVYFKKFIKKVLSNDIRLTVIGDKTRFSKDLQEIITKCEVESQNNNKFNLCIALNYGGRQEIVYAVNKLIESGKAVDMQAILDNLYTAPFGEPDLIIRTGGEKRLSNFLLFQGAYSELYFTDVLWPDFNAEELDKAILDFSTRQRRFGKV